MHDPALHLFVDDQHLRTVYGMRRVFGQPEQERVPLLADLPGRHLCWASVLREPDGRWRLWYQSVTAVSAHELASSGVWGRGDEFGYFPDRHPLAVRETQTSMIGYAESRDGRKWHCPDLGLIEWQGSRHNNLVLDGSGAARQFDYTVTNMDTVTVIRDDAEPNPARRYKMICHWETVHVWDNHPTLGKLGRSEAYLACCWANRAKYLLVSPDGLHWDGPLQRIKNCAGGGDYAGVARDERHQRYWFCDRAPVGLPGVGYRSAGVCVSANLEQWPSTVEMVFTPGEYEEYGRKYQHHGWRPFNYGDQDLCLLEYAIGGHPIAGVLGTHRDGQPWRRANGDAFFLRRGAPAEFDETIVAMTQNPPLAVGDQLYFYYNGRRLLPDQPEASTAHLGLATLRLDGFAAMAVDQAFLRPNGAPAMLLTQPLPVTRDELQLNLTGHGGTARAALLDGETLMPLPGYGLEDCLPLPENAVRAPVHWRDQATVASLRFRQVLVLVQMRAGQLYAIRL